MNKLFMKLFLLGMLVNFTFAFDDFNSFGGGTFVGFEGAYTKNNYSKEKNGYIKQYSDSTFDFGLKAGQNFNSYRLYGQVNVNTRSKDSYENTKISWMSEEILANADWTPQISPTFKFIVGSYAGLGIFQIDEKDPPKEADLDKFGLLMGLKLGAILDIDFNKAFEFGWKVDKTLTGPEITKNGFFAGLVFKFN